MLYFLYDFGNSIWNVIKSMTAIDIIDIILITFLVYKGIKLIRETRAGQLIRGILLFIAIYMVSKEIGFKVLTFLLKNTLDIGLLAVLIMFQPELRRMLEKVGRANVSFIGFADKSDEIVEKWSIAVNAICESCEELSLTTTGALFVIERQTRLGEQIDTGTKINAEPSKELFGNIFYPKTPLHDGAVIIRDGVVLAAACYLPKPQKEELINKQLGSRHRAAIGMSENSDAIVVAVSEETGIISVAENGELRRGLTIDELRSILNSKVVSKQKDIVNRKKNRENRLKSLKKAVRRRGKTK
ncbi:MAG: TIGR00159 family protein [Clostridiales bacterium]|nr:TIGR00159 family protein [Clostridiales bacterium]